MVLENGCGEPLSIWMRWWAEPRQRSRRPAEIGLARPPAASGDRRDDLVDDAEPSRRVPSRLVGTDQI